MITCNDIRKMLKKGQDITDKTQQSQEMQHHIEQCPACKKEVESLNKAWNLLDTLPEITVSDNFESRFWAKLNNEPNSFLYHAFFPQLMYKFAYIMVLWAVVIGTSFLLTKNKPDRLPYNTPIQRFVQPNEYNSIRTTYSRRLPKKNHKNYVNGGIQL